ncbi:hypothetical protein IV102_33955 [bacterium]|nr:hypothetical protein [bacterium]
MPWELLLAHKDLVRGESVVQLTLHTLDALGGPLPPAEVERRLQALGCRTAVRLQAALLGADPQGLLCDLRAESLKQQARQALRQRMAGHHAQEESSQALSRKLQGLFSLNAQPKPTRTVVAVYNHGREPFCWQALPEGKPRAGEPEELVEALTASDLLVTSISGLQAPCPILEIRDAAELASVTLGRLQDGGLADLAAFYAYGCLHGYVLTGKGQRPVDWRSQDQADLWERLFRLQKSNQVTVDVRDQGRRVLITRDSTQPSMVMVKSQTGWESLAVKDILAIHGEETLT